MRLVPVLLCAVALPALAAPRTDPAREHYERGLAKYNLAEFDAAIGEFKEAYEISKAPRLLFNIAQAYRLKKDWEHALFFYNAYLRAEPNPPNRDDVEQRIDEMKKEAATAATQPTAMSTPSSTTRPPGPGGEPTPPGPGGEPAPPPGSTPPTGTAPGSKAPSATPGGTAAAPAPAPPPSADVAQAQQARRTLRRRVMWAGVAGGVVGVAGVAVGAGLLGLAASDASRLHRVASSGGTWTAQDDAVYREGDRAQTAGVVLVSVGGVLVVAGGLVALEMWRRNR